MDQQETLALYERAEVARAAAKAAGKNDDDAHAAATAVWNAWAGEMLAKRKQLEEAGTWAAGKDYFGTIEPTNDQTRAWFRRAAAVFSISDNKHTFDQAVDCRGWIFPGNTRFDGAKFKGAARFGGATFVGASRFSGATLTCDAWFDGATFTGAAVFGEATFKGDARFGGAKFEDTALFDEVTFAGGAGFRGAKLSGDARFDRASFTGDARFDGAVFSGGANFERVKFDRDAWFDEAKFGQNARFYRATFREGAGFSKATIAGDAVFGRVVFDGSGWFDSVTFSGKADFDLARFNGYTNFAKARFRQAVLFNAIKGETAFTLDGARFREVPDFIQANFVQAPRLDNVIVAPALALAAPAATTDWQRLLSWPKRFAGGTIERLFHADSNASARYRALKRLAIQGHDLEREQMFHAGEIRSSRFATDWPIHWKLWSKEAWTSIWRFWFGLIYEVLSDFGRSVMRPLVAWLILLVVSASVYLGANPDMTREREKLIAGGTSLLMAYAETTLAAWQRNQPCVASGAGVQGLPDAVRSVTSAVGEALHLSFANGAVLGDVGSPDTGTRTYGCLYGLAPVSGEARLSIVPYPGIVSTMTKVQKALSALLIFLFGLAVRNMLKMK